jgi:hypothetical protein
MTLGDVLDGGFKLFRANLKAMLLVGSAFLVPLALLSAFGQRWTQPFSLMEALDDPSLAESTQSYLPNVWELASLAAYVLLGLVFMPTCIGAITSLVARSYLGEQATAGQALREAFRRFWRFLGASLLVSLLTAAPLLPAVALVVLGALAESPALVGLGLLLMVPGFLATIALVTLLEAVVPAIVVEELGPARAIRRSFALVRSRFWPVLGILLLALLLAYLLSSVLSVPFTILVLVLGGDAGWPFLALGTLVPSLLVTAWGGIVATLIYFDLRIRREGFDLQLLAAGLSGGGPPAR